MCTPLNTEIQVGDCTVFLHDVRKLKMWNGYVQKVIDLVYLNFVLIKDNEYIIDK